MSVKKLDTRESNDDAVDIIAVLLARMTSSERRKLDKDNAKAQDARKVHVSFTKDKGVRLSRYRAHPKHIIQLRSAMRANDPKAIKAAWDSSERWLMADIPANLASRAANRVESTLSQT